MGCYSNCNKILTQELLQVPEIAVPLHTVISFSVINYVVSMRCPTRVAQLIFFIPVRTVGSIAAENMDQQKIPVVLAQRKIPVVLRLLHHQHKACIASGSPLAQLSQLALRRWLAYLPARCPALCKRYFQAGRNGPTIKISAYFLIQTL